MRPEAYQLFAQLCETLVNEASTAIDQFKNSRGGRQVAQYLHNQMGLPHDIGYTSRLKISWTDLKNAANGSWVLIACKNGSAAIRYDGNTYTAVATDGSLPPETFRDDRGGNILDFIKRKVGDLRSFYVSLPKDPNDRAFNATQNREYRNKRDVRRARDRTAAVGSVTQDSIVAKFKPMWARALTAAIADIKGMVANQIKNDAFEKATRKIHRLGEMSKALDDIQSGNLDDAPDFVRKAVTLSIYMTAAHFYPDSTGEVTRSYGGYHVDNPKGVDMVLKDISNGDQSKLSTVLAFFKRNLISG